MINKEFYWFKSWWSLAEKSFDRRPSALLLLGPRGLGKRQFGLELAASWLCQSPLADRSACGQCASCNWMVGNTHPDFRWVRPDAEAPEPEAEGTGAEGAGTEPAEASTDDAKKKSQEIRIEQIRGLAGFANVGSHRGGLRVAMIAPANRMNYAAANALLKTLEEPPPSLVFVLVADTLAGLPATILSRCRRLNLNVDDAELAKRQTALCEASEWLLPLLTGGEVDPLRWAEKAGKSPPGEALDLMMRWMNDASRVRAGLAARAFPEHDAALKQQALRIRSPQSWAQTLSELQKIRGIAEHPLNPKLFYESIFDRYRRALVAQD